MYSVRADGYLCNIPNIPNKPNKPNNLKSYTALYTNPPSPTTLLLPSLPPHSSIKHSQIAM